MARTGALCAWQESNLTDRQCERLDVLRLLPEVEVYVWRPSDWNELVEILTGTAPRQAA